MEEYAKLKSHLSKGYGFITDIDNSKKLKVISHLDADGICAAALTLKCLKALDVEFELEIFHQIDSKNIEKLAAEDFHNYIFLDLGSGHIRLINERLKGKSVLILDHHEVEDIKENDNVIHINPHLIGINGGTDISGSGVAYLFFKELIGSVEEKGKKLAEFDIKNYAYLPVIGAIGDNQEHDGFLGLNNIVLDDARSNSGLSVTRDIKLFAAYSKPLYRIIKFFEPPIPGVGRRDNDAFEFLESIGISPKKGNQWTMYHDLSAEDREELKETIIDKIMYKEGVKIKERDAALFNIYTLENETGALRDLREYSTILNACGRMGKPMLGVEVCIGEGESKENALKVLSNYRKELLDAIEWFNINKGKTKDISVDENFIIINSKDMISPTIIGTLTSIVSRYKETKVGTVVLGLSRNGDESTKISLRIKGRNNSINLKLLIGKILKKIKGEYGGHKVAAGALISISDEDKFIEYFKEELSKYNKRF